MNFLRLTRAGVPFKLLWHYPLFTLRDYEEFLTAHRLIEIDETLEAVYRLQLAQTDNDTLKEHKTRLGVEYDKLLYNDPARNALQNFM